VPPEPAHRVLPKVAIALLRKPGAKRFVNMLPRISDLPGKGWVRLRNDTYRTSGVNPVTGPAIGAQKMKSVTASLSFKQQSTSRSLMAQVVPFANEQDAEATLNWVPAAQPAVDGVTVPGSDSTRAYELETVDPTGAEMIRAVRGRVGSVVFLVWGSALGDEAWSWNEVVSVAETMVRRISLSQY
jgi:hypothetical protein